MRRASQLFSQKDRDAVAEAVRQAETRTSAEIVPVVATSSGRYDRAEDIFGILTALGAVAVAWLLFQGVDTSGWGAATRLTLPVVLALFVAGFILGSAAATWFPALKLPFIPRREMEEELERSAAAAFQGLRVRGTGAGVGVLLYVSLLERRVRVLPDDPVAAKLGPDAWQEVCGLVVAGLREGRPADGMCRAIARSGELLATPFPWTEADRNEIANELRLIDG
jgi:putative membrane protein